MNFTNFVFPALFALTLVGVIFFLVYQWASRTAAADSSLAGAPVHSHCPKETESEMLSREYLPPKITILTRAGTPVRVKVLGTVDDQYLVCRPRHRQVFRRHPAA